MDIITALALSIDVETERVILQGSIRPAMKLFLSDAFVDIIFCSTRKYKNFISNSFSELLTKMELPVDIAIVRIVKIGDVMDAETMSLSIKKDRLSVKKFTFFSTLLSAYKANGEIHSVTKMSKEELSKVDMHGTRERLSLINYNLRHYIKLSHIMDFSLTIKHDFTHDEVKSIFTHIVKSNSQLVAIGARRLSIKSLFTNEMPMEKLMREASVNTIAYYTQED